MVQENIRDKIFTYYRKLLAIKLDKDAGSEQWLDWKWQMKHTIRTIEQFEYLMNIKFSPEEREKLNKTNEKFPLSITPYYLSLIDKDNIQNDPVCKQAFLNERELIVSKSEMSDPLAEDQDSPVPGITHRYPDRVLFLVSNICAMYCRHCTRKRKVGDVDSIPNKEQIMLGLDYIRNHPEVRDVLLSGGDPFLLSDSYLDWILEELSKIPTVQVIRIGTRIPVVLPYRVTDNLVNVLKKYKNLWINTHFNHPQEVTTSAKIATAKLSDVGIPLGNQTVLLAEVNDCPKIIKALVHRLVENRIRPYYLYQCDLSEGLTHFRTPIGKGIEIMESLIGHTSGFAVPTYVVDAPAGGGKIPITPNYLVSWSTNKVVLRNYEGVICSYQEPLEYPHNFCDRDCLNCKLQLQLMDGEEINAIGIEKLLSDFDESISLTPEDNERMSNRTDNIE